MCLTMTPASQTPLAKEIIGLPTARIDTQDEQYIVPLREFLTDYGCSVFVNQPPPPPLTYWMVCGDPHFVKKFFLYHPYHPDEVAKRLIIAYGVARDDLEDFGQRGVKVVLVDPTPLKQEIVRTIFSFLFTGRGRLLDIRKEKPDDAFGTMPPREVQREPEPLRVEEDRRRIATTMTHIFQGRPSTSGAAKREPSQRTALWAGVFGTILVALPVIWYFIGLAVSGASLILSATFLARGQTGVALRLAQGSISATTTSRRALSVISVPLHVFGGVAWVTQQERLLGLLEELGESEIGLLGVSSRGREVAIGLLAPEAQRTPTVSAVEDLRGQIGNLRAHLALSQAELTGLLGSGRFPFSLTPVARLGQRVGEKLASLSRAVAAADQFLTLYPHVGGFRQKKTYLVLLQNSFELRPTGGFIGAVLLISFLDGKLVEMEAQDVYTLDGQLKGHVDPPSPIRELLGQEHWYLRDSNWNPDFREGGKMAAWFYEKETGKPLDGVIAVSLPFILDLLSVTGPLELPDYNDRISRDNFFAKSLLYTQVDFFPGSTQKRDFLGVLAGALISRLTTARGVPPEQFLRVVLNSLAAHDIMFYFVDAELEELVARYGWAGTLTLPTQCATARSCLVDFFAPIEANLGVNKVNYYISREVLDQVAVREDGEITHTITMRWRNRSSDNPHEGGGAYQLYLRVYLPPDSEVSAILLDGTSLPPQTAGSRSVPYGETLVDTRGFTGVSAALQVPPQGERELLLVYRRQTRLPEEASVGYELMVRKQPGMSKDTWQTIFMYPSVWLAQPKSSPGQPPPIAKDSSLKYNTTLTRDETFRVLFSK